MLRHIAWFNEALIEPDPKGGLRSTDERVRRRCLEPACALEDLGVDCSVFGKLNDADPAEVSKLLQKLKTDIVVIGVFSDPSLLKLARTAKQLGCYVIADFGDQITISDDFEKLAALADQIVAATPQSLDLLKGKGLSAHIVADCGGDNSADSVAKAWLVCFKNLRMKPPACANTNTPPNDAPGDNA